MLRTYSLSPQGTAGTVPAIAPQNNASHIDPC